MSADFDAIYQEEEVAPENGGSSSLDALNARLLPEPIVIRGAGNMTV